MKKSPVSQMELIYQMLVTFSLVIRTAIDSTLPASHAMVFYNRNLNARM